MKLLETTVNDKGEEIQVYSGIVGGSPAFSSMLHHYLKLLDENLAYRYLPVNNDDFILWAQYPDGTILGGICFNNDTDTVEVIKLKLGWTEKEHRSKGINTILNRWLEVESKDRGCHRIISTVHINNEVRLRSSAKMGFHPLFYVMYKKID